MRRRFDARAEILRCGYQSLPEITLPKAVDRNSRRGWASWIDNPSCQPEPIQWSIGRQRMQYRGHRRRYFVLWPQTVTAFEDVCGARMFALLKNE